MKFVAFAVGEHVCAADMAAITQILRVPALVRMPLAPASLLGIAPLRGNILPLISLGAALGIEDGPLTEAARAIVVAREAPLGFVVDRVIGAVDIAQEQLEGAPEGVAFGSGRDCVSGVARDVGEHGLVLLLNLQRVSEEAMRVLAPVRAAPPEAVRHAARADSADVVAAAALKLLSFAVGNQTYGVELEQVQEILRIPDQVLRMPLAAKPLLGIISSRRGLLPLISLRELLGLPAQESNERERIIVLRSGACQLGVVVDCVDGVLCAATARLDIAPRALTLPKTAVRIGQIYRREGCDSLLAILSADALLQEFGESATAGDRDSSDVTVVPEGMEATTRLLAFRLDAQEFALRLDGVQEIVPWGASLTPVPQSPDAVEGVVNLRGVVLPLINLRRHLETAGPEYGGAQRIIVLRLPQGLVGLIVDSAIEILDVPCRLIEPTPTIAGRASKGLTQIANLPRQDRMLQLLDPAHLIGSGPGAEFSGLVSA
jgi:purine-binding chemotaxis protein CheW